MKATRAPFPSGPLRFVSEGTKTPPRRMLAATPAPTAVPAAVVVPVGTPVNVVTPITQAPAPSGMSTGATIAIGLTALAAGVGLAYLVTRPHPSLAPRTTVRR